MLALSSEVGQTQKSDGVRALRLRVKSGKDRRTLVCTDEFHMGLFVGNELSDQYGEMWTITKIEPTEVLATIPFPQRPATPGRDETH